MNLAFLSTEQTRALYRLFYYLLPYVAYEPKVTNHFDKEYDYIVAGAGSAGSVVAARLSEDPCVKVLLLEAGGKVDPNTEIPGIGTLNQYTKNDWQWPTYTQLRDTKDFQVKKPLSTGKGIGGSSLLNYMVYTRCNRMDYDQWAENGATGWRWKDVLPYFQKSEDNTDTEILDDGYHSMEGPLTVSTPRDNNKIKEAFNEAGPELGYEYRDINGAKQTGFAIEQGTIRNGRRCSTAKAYLVPAQDRPNLDIVNEAYVQKVLINNKKKAYGVRVEKGGKVYDIKARKEVIVSLGAFQTPKILMLSGIGPKDHLQKFGIKVIADLPVGDNLQNHVGNTVITFTAKPAKPIVSEMDLVKDAERYQRNQSGPFTSLAGFEGVAFTNSKNVNPGLDWPDLELYVLIKLPKVLKPGFEVPEKECENNDEDDSIVWFPTILRPKSRGTVRLNSTNPYDYPLIDFNIFDNEEDFENVVESMRQCLEITKTNAFKKIGAKLSTKKLKGCENYEIYSEDYLRCTARKHALTAYHPSCSCKMGSEDDDTAVLDPQLKVKGIKNLRVVDGSIMPTIVSGNLNAPIVMIAEKASDMIKMDNPDRKKCSMEDC